MSQKGRPRPRPNGRIIAWSITHCIPHFYKLELIKREKLNKLSISNK